MVAAAIISPLSDSERGELAKLEAVIASGIQTYWSVAEALRMIRENGLYRENYSTFKDYCLKRWQFDPSRARQLINGLSAAEEFESVTGVTLPNEYAARAFGRVEEELRPIVALSVAATAKATNKPPTSGMIERQAEIYRSAAAYGAVAVNGEDTPITAALSDEEHEAHARRVQRLVEDNENEDAAYGITFTVDAQNMKLIAALENIPDWLTGHVEIVIRKRKVKKSHE